MPRKVLLAVCCICALLVGQAAGKTEDKSGQVQAFTDQFESLRSELQSQQAKLEEALKKVASRESGDGDAGGSKALLLDELKSGKSALSAAGSKLGKIEGQLKGVLERALTAETSAAKAEEDIQALKKQHATVITDLQSEISAAKTAQGSTDEMLSRAEKAEELAKQLKQQLQSSEKTGSDKLAQLAGKLQDLEARSQKDLQAASQKASEFTTKLEGAEKQLEAAKSRLKAAEDDSATTRLNLEQMMQKAEEATVQVQLLLKRSLENWLPGWMEERYAKIMAGIRPTLKQGWDATNEYTSGAQAQASDLYAKSRDYTSKTWKSYEPHVTKMSSDWQGTISSSTESIQKNAGPRLQAAGQAVYKQFSQSQKDLGRALSGPQILKARRHLQSYLNMAKREFKKIRRDLERFFAGHMKRFPALVPYTKRPYISWITYSLVVAPIFLIVLPLLGGSGNKRSRSRGDRGAANASHKNSAAPAASKSAKKGGDAGKGKAGH